MRTTKQMRQDLRRIRDHFQTSGVRVTVTRSQRGVEPILIIGDTVYSVDEAITRIDQTERTTTSTHSDSTSRDPSPGQGRISP